MAVQQRAFPEIEGPDFVKSDEVADVAQDVLAEHGASAGVARLFETARAVGAGDLSIAYLFNAKVFDQRAEEANHDAAGKCIKAPRLWHDVTGIDVAIWLREDMWRTWPADVRAAAVLHELLHVDASYDKKGQLLLSVRKHDVEDFVDVVRIYGPIFGYAEGGSPGYVRAANLWADKTRREPTKLRRVDGEVNLDQLHGDVARAIEPDDESPA